MITKNILFAAALLASSNFAHADAKNFEGISVNVGAYVVGSSLYADLGADGVVDGLGKNSFAADISVDYGLALSSDTVVLIGGSYGLSNPTFFSSSGQLDATGKAGDRMSVFAAPGLVVSEKVLAYGKLAYVSTKPKFTGDFAGVAAKSHSGIGYGGGVRILVNPNFYVNFEAMNNDYGNKTYSGSTLGGTALFAGVALGYKF